MPQPLLQPLTLMTTWSLVLTGRGGSLLEPRKQVLGAVPARGGGILLRPPWQLLRTPPLARGPWHHPPSDARFSVSARVTTMTVVRATMRRRKSMTRRMTRRMTMMGVSM